MMKPRHIDMPRHTGHGLSRRLVLAFLFCLGSVNATCAFEFELVSSFGTADYELEFAVKSVTVDPLSETLLLGTSTELIEVTRRGELVARLVTEEPFEAWGFFDRALAVNAFGRIFSMGPAPRLGNREPDPVRLARIFTYTRDGQRIGDGRFHGGTTFYGGMAIRRSGPSFTSIFAVDIGVIKTLGIQHVDGALSNGLFEYKGLPQDHFHYASGIVFLPERELFLVSAWGGPVERDTVWSSRPRILGLDVAIPTDRFSTVGRYVGFAALEPLGIASVSDIALDPNTGHIWAVDPEQKRVFELRYTPSFRRGDANGDGRVNLSDAVFLLGGLFLDAAWPRCEDAADSDDSGEIEVSDALVVLEYLFHGAGGFPPSGSACVTDETKDTLGCNAQQPCVLEGATAE